MFGPELQVGSLGLWRSMLDIAVVAVIIYQLLLLLRGSRSGAVLFGIALIFGIFYLSQDEVLDLPTLNWLLDRFINSIVVLLVVLFQDDIRRALSSAMRAPLSMSLGDPASSAELEEILRACAVLSQRSIGALIVIEQEADLDRYVEQGVKIDAEVSWQVLMSLFIPSHMNPTHDGAVIIRKGRIATAACFLPLAYGDDIPGNLGSRHRAAMGLADETDALVLVVSEESGLCAIAHMGQVDLELKPSALRERLQVLFGQRRERGTGWQKRWQRRIVHHSPSPLSARITGEHTIDPSRTRELRVEKAAPPRRQRVPTIVDREGAAPPEPDPPPDEATSPEGAPPEPALEPLVSRPRDNLRMIDETPPDALTPDLPPRGPKGRGGDGQQEAS